MGYWKTRVVPRIMKLFEKDGGKKAAAVEACKAFDDAKEEMNKAFEEKKTDLLPKVLHLFEQSSPETKATIREPTEAAIKKTSPAIAKFIDDLAEIEFPGAKLAGEAVGKYGAALVIGPITFILEKVATVLPAPPPEEIAAAAAAAAEEDPKTEEIAEKTEKKEETPSSEIVPDQEEQKKEEIAEAPSSDPVPEHKIEEIAEKSEEKKKVEEIPKKPEEAEPPFASV